MAIRKLFFLVFVVLCMNVNAFADDMQITDPPQENSGAMPVDENQGKTYAVDCYQGNPETGLNRGNLTVTSPSEAGPACNATFYDCQDKCYGCYYGPDGKICADKNGSLFQQ